MSEGSVLTYDPATNGTEWIPVRGTINDLSPREDASTQELSNITIPDSPQDVHQIYYFGEHWQEHIAEAPARCSAQVLEEEVMEQALPDWENVSSISSEESDSDEGTPRSCCSDSISQTEEESEDREELTAEPAKELTVEPTKELTVE